MALSTNFKEIFSRDTMNYGLCAPLQLYWEKNMVVVKVLASTIMQSNQTLSYAIIHKLLIACFHVLKICKV